MNTTNKYSLSWRTLPIHNHSSFTATEASVSLVIIAFWTNLTASIMHKNGTRVYCYRQEMQSPCYEGVWMQFSVFMFCSFVTARICQLKVNLGLTVEKIQGLCYEEVRMFVPLHGEATGMVLWGGTDVCTSSWRRYMDCYEGVWMFILLHGEDTRIVLWGGIVVHTSSWRRYMGLLWGGIDVHTSSWRRYMDTYGEVWMFVPLHIL